MKARALLVAVLVPCACVAACVGGRTTLETDAGADASTCAAASLRFRLVAPVGAWCVGSPTSCDGEWLYLRRAGGEELTIDRPCVADCASCEPIACPAICAAPTRMSATGAVHVWDGTTWERSSCSSGDGCVQRSCAAPGRYVATMCAYRESVSDGIGGFCVPERTPLCADVAFDWPPPAGVDEIVGHVAEPAPLFHGGAR